MPTEVIMSDKEKEELKARGFIITEKGHVMVMTFLSVLIFLGGLFTLYAVNYSEKEKIKMKVDNHEIRINELQKNIELFKEIQLEIKYNVKALAEKQGIVYQKN